MGGHGVAIGGALIDSGRFNWDQSGLFPELTESYAGFHGMNFVEEFGPAAYITRARKEGLRDFGAALSPTNAFHLLQGIETLPMRMEKHVSNTAAIVEYLDGHEAVSTVHHPAIKSHPDHHLAQALLPKGCGAVFSFELAGGRSAGKAFIDSLALFSHLANVGDAKSLVIHPATTTHSRMDDEALLDAGISPGLVRLSVGLEDSADLIADLSQALKRAMRASS
jgi:O-acetylhomoserine (thiol)-lyase